MIGENLNLSSGVAFSDELIEAAKAYWYADEPFVAFDEFDGFETGDE